MPTNMCIIVIIIIADKRTCFTVNDTHRPLLATSLWFFEFIDAISDYNYSYTYVYYTSDQIPLSKDAMIRKSFIPLVQNMFKKKIRFKFVNNFPK